jgi:hypothetical protein
MPVAACFSYSSDLPPGIDNRNAAQPALRDLPRMPHPCFSYSTGEARGNPPTRPGAACFSYSAGVARAKPPTRPAGVCFSYSAEVPLGGHPSTPGPTGGVCFSY